MEDFFVTNGLTFKTESDKETTDEASEPLVFDIKSIDMIYNKDYEQLTHTYKIPIFFKSADFMADGYVDNGRHLV